MKDILGKIVKQFIKGLEGTMEKSCAKQERKVKKVKEDWIKKYNKYKVKIKN